MAWWENKIFLKKRTEGSSCSCEHVLFPQIVIENWGVTFNDLCVCISRVSKDCFWIVNEAA